MLGLDGSGRSPAYPYFGGAVRVLVPYDPNWQEVRDVGNPISTTEDSHSDSTS